MATFNLPVRVYMEDVDAGGIVYYANYLKYFERARTEFVRTLGVQLRESLRNNINYVVYSIDIKYIKSARLDDQLIITVSVPEFSKTSMTFLQEALNTEGETLTKASVQIACTHLDNGKPRRLPENLVSAIQASQA